jgi:serine/threonine kinase 16
MSLIQTLCWLGSTVARYVLAFYDYCQQFLVTHFTGKVIQFDTGIRVIVGKQIAEGGFSYIFLAHETRPTVVVNDTFKGRRSRQRRNQPQTTYALKRIHCPDAEILDRCRYEADVHRAVMNNSTSANGTVSQKQQQHQQQLRQYVMPLHGFTILQQDCYMLFPLCTESLRNMVNRKNPFLQSPTNPPSSTTFHHNINTNMPAPISELDVLHLFRQICLGVQALHTCGYTHRDVKIENVMIRSQLPRSQIPYLVLMDFGSAGPLQVSISSRIDIMEVVELASQHTTMPYRPPELLEGGLQYTNQNTQSGATTNPNIILDYRAVDVWSLGCTLHAIMYGASPFECEFIGPSNHNGNNAPVIQKSAFKIVDCTHLSILGNVPVPKYAPISLWYSNTIRKELLMPMLQPIPNERPELSTIIHVIEQMINDLGGTITDMEEYSDSAAIDHPYTHTHSHSHPPYRDAISDTHDATDGIALLSRIT